MTTVRTTSCYATTGRRSRRCFSTSRAGAPKGPQRGPYKGFYERPPKKARHEQRRNPSGHSLASHRGDDPALLVSADLVVAAPTGAGVLAGPANHNLGIPAELHLAECRVLCPRRRHLCRRYHPVGYPVSRAARIFDLV